MANIIGNKLLQNGYLKAASNSSYPVSELLQNWYKPYRIVISNFNKDKKDNFVSFDNYNNDNNKIRKFTLLVSDVSKFKLSLLFE